MLGATADTCSSQSTEAFCCDGISTAPCTWQPMSCRSSCVPNSAVFGSTVDTGLCQSTKVSLVTVSASQQRKLRTGQSVHFPAWTRMLSCPLWCSTDARYRRAENCGAPQLQFVDQVESSLSGNRHVRTVQTVQRSALSGSGQLRGSSWGPAQRCRAEGVMSTGTWPHNKVHLLACKDKLVRQIIRPHHHHLQAFLHKHALPCVVRRPFLCEPKR